MSHRRLMIFVLLATGCVSTGKYDTLKKQSTPWSRRA